MPRLSDEAKIAVGGDCESEEAEDGEARQVGRKAAAAHELGTHLDAGLGECTEVPGAPLLDAQQSGWAGKIGDVAMTGRDQMPCRDIGSGLVVDENAGDLDAGNVLIDENNVAALADDVGEGAVVGRIGQHHQPVDVVIVQAVEAVDLAAAVAAGRGHEDGVAMTLGFVLDRRSEVSKERLADLGYDEPHCFAAAGRQPFGEQVRPIVETADRRIDACRCRRRQLDAVVEVAGYRGWRDSRVLRDVVNCCHVSLTPAPAGASRANAERMPTIDSLRTLGAAPRERHMPPCVHGAPRRGNARKRCRCI